MSGSVPFNPIGDSSTMSQCTDDINAAAVMRALPVSSYIVSVYVNGLYGIIAWVTIWALVSRPLSYNRRKVWLVLVTVLYVSSSINAGLCWGLLSYAFQDYGTTSRVVCVLDQQPVWYRGLGNAMFSLNTFLADCIFVWRCWVIWDNSWLAVAFPIATTIAGTILSILSQIGQLEVVKKTAPGTLSERFISLSTPYFALTLVTTVYTAGMITLRIFQTRRQARNVGHLAQPYSKMMEILVESALLYAATTFVLVVLFAMKVEALSYAEAVQAQSSGIAPTLIILRVSLGYARPDSQWSTKSTTTTAANAMFTTVDNVKTDQEYRSSETRTTRESVQHFGLPDCSYNTEGCSGTESDSFSKKEYV